MTYIEQPVFSHLSLVCAVLIPQKIDIVSQLYLFYTSEESPIPGHHALGPLLQALTPRYIGLHKFYVTVNDVLFSLSIPTRVCLVQYLPANFSIKSISSMQRQRTVESGRELP